jgi:hypothetical protein
MKKKFTLKAIITFTVMLLTLAVNAQTVLYSKTFNTGVGADSIVGTGKLVLDATPGFDSVFLNGHGGTRANYFLVRDTVFGRLQQSGSKELSIAFWVNRDTITTGYYWTPLFSAYGAAPNPNNTWPMMVIESRLWFQENCAGWCDFTGADNVNGTNFESTAWLDDNKWHYYTITITESSVKVYIDGVVQNSWNLNGTDGHTVGGLFTNGRELDYICLGGNQAWNWNDVDPAFRFDDLTIYSNALTVEQINAIITAKIPTGLKETFRETVSVFPNPASEYIALKGLKSYANVEIMDIQGKTALKIYNISSGEKINMNKLKPGAYFVKITTGNNVVVNKIVHK